MPLLKYKTIEKKLGVKFRTKRLLGLAFTHSSVRSNEQSRIAKKSNETLEFLGDAVLELLIREYLFKAFPEATEGDLSEMKKVYTNAEVLAKIGRTLELGEFLIMDKGEELNGGRDRQSNIASCLESIIGALYLDRGLRCARQFVEQKILSQEAIEYEDYKSLMNQWAMRHRNKISYRIIKEEGPPHHKTFYIGLYVNGQKMTDGLGVTKKKAEQEAARDFLAKFVK